MGREEIWVAIGPGLSGAVFGAAWWFWVDAVVCSLVTVSFLHYLPGIFASFSALMFNCIRRDEIQDYSPFDDEGCGFFINLKCIWILLRSFHYFMHRMWLFLAYVIAFVSLAGSVGFLLQDALVPTGPSTWTGVAGVLQCFFVLVSGLIYWTSRSLD